MNQDNQVRVWDPFIRIFHWLLVVAFFTAYLTEGEPEWLHAWAGYLIVVLLVLRIVWGFIGSEHARFSNFVFSPGTVLAYLRDNMRGRAEYYRGHNPAGGAMILGIIVSLLVTAGAGMVVLAGEEGEGPLAGWLIATPQMQTETAPVAGDDETEEHEESALVETAEEVHEVLANLTLALVILHVIGVIVESLRERQNLVRSMFTGYKRGT
ncbi:cytochrome B [Halovibrio salipaludis]|uniref:Cytochrome B n=1 Tax=Halovibrio salipaludis TaxID=2032626 RepID=A0A2A2FAR3_9GAMM|nr:cytochrome b/b6 domain-containing protein [Halovibrio salipaludis]PAU81712.1 cytochrome B [Halovibrio salipaludis]